jgi:predicted aspartyl protease
MQRWEKCRCAALTAVVLLVSGCDQMSPRRTTAPADPAQGEIPFRMVGAGGAALVVSTHINGQGPYDLILDTGATMTCVSQTLAGDLELPSRRTGVGIAIGVGASGQVRMVQVDSLRVGEASAEGLPVCVLDLAAVQTVAADVHGLLGLNFLRNYHLTLDFERNVLVLGPPGGG